MTYKLLTQYNSPNYWSGSNSPQYIVVHHWGADGQSFMGVVNWLCNSRSRVSAHYVVEDDLVACLVNHSDAAWHAGNRWYNTHSIGIECRPECTSGDVDTLVELIATLYKQYGVIPVIGHKDIVNTACPGRYYPLLTDIQRRATELYKSGKMPSPAPTPSYVDKKGKITVDGEFGHYSVIKMQNWLNSPYKDGVLSGQLASCKYYICNFKWGCSFGSGGSYTVKMLQNKIGAGADGYIGKNTIMHLQKFLNNNGYNLVVDGIAGYNTCKAFQTYLNQH